MGAEYPNILNTTAVWELLGKRGVHLGCVFACKEDLLVLESGDLGETSNGAKSLEMEVRDVVEIELVTGIFYSPPDQN